MLAGCFLRWCWCRIFSSRWALTPSPLLLLVIFMSKQQGDVRVAACCKEQLLGFQHGTRGRLHCTLIHHQQRPSHHYHRPYHKGRFVLWFLPRSCINGNKNTAALCLGCLRHETSWLSIWRFVVWLRQTFTPLATPLPLFRITKTKAIINTRVIMARWKIPTRRPKTTRMVMEMSFSLPS